MEAKRAAPSPLAAVSMFGLVPDMRAPKEGDLVDCDGAIGWSGCACVVSTTHSPGGFELSGEVWVRECVPLGAPPGYEPFEVNWPIERVRVVS